MRVLVQWTRRRPRDWEEIDSADWGSLPRRPVPAPGQLGAADDAAGWVMALNVQGVEFTGYDHYAVSDIPGGCQVTAWNDDPDDDPSTPYAGMRWTFLDPAPDPRFDWKVNTRQLVEFWTDEPITGAASGGAHINRPRAEFVPPTDRARHGVWVEDADLERHRGRRVTRSWREWVR